MGKPVRRTPERCTCGRPQCPNNVTPKLKNRQPNRCTCGQKDCPKNVTSKLKNFNRHREMVAKSMREVPASRPKPRLPSRASPKIPTSSSSASGTWKVSSLAPPKEPAFKYQPMSRSPSPQPSTSRSMMDSSYDQRRFRYSSSDDESLPDIPPITPPKPSFKTSQPAKMSRPRPRSPSPSKSDFSALYSTSRSLSLDESDFSGSRSSLNSSYDEDRFVGSRYSDDSYLSDVKPLSSPMPSFRGPRYRSPSSSEISDESPPKGIGRSIRVTAANLNEVKHELLNIRLPPPIREPSPAYRQKTKADRINSFKPKNNLLKPKNNLIQPKIDSFKSSGKSPKPSSPYRSREGVENRNINFQKTHQKPTSVESTRLPPFWDPTSVKPNRPPLPSASGKSKRPAPFWDADSEEVKRIPREMLDLKQRYHPSPFISEPRSVNSISVESKAAVKQPENRKPAKKKKQKRDPLRTYYKYVPDGNGGFTTVDLPLESEEEDEVRTPAKKKHKRNPLKKAYRLVPDGEGGLMTVDLSSKSEEEDEVRTPAKKKRKRNPLKRVRVVPDGKGGLMTVYLPTDSEDENDYLQYMPQRPPATSLEQASEKTGQLPSKSTEQPSAKPWDLPSPYASEPSSVNSKSAESEATAKQPENRKPTKKKKKKKRDPSKRYYRVVPDGKGGFTTVDLPPESEDEDVDPNLYVPGDDYYPILRAHFACDPFPSHEKAAKLARDMLVTPQKIQAYFSGRRATMHNRLRRRGEVVDGPMDTRFWARSEGPGNLDEMFWKVGFETENLDPEAGGGDFTGFLFDSGLDAVKEKIKELEDSGSDYDYYW